MQQLKGTNGIKIMPNKVAVRLGNGTIISLSDLPAKDTKRWVASNKASVVKVFMAGLISEEEVIARYDLSSEEFQNWLHRYMANGKDALKVVNIRKIPVRDEEGELADK